MSRKGQGEFVRAVGPNGRRTGSVAKRFNVQSSLGLRRGRDPFDQERCANTNQNNGNIEERSPKHERRKCYRKQLWLEGGDL